MQCACMCVLLHETVLQCTEDIWKILHSSNICLNALMPQDVIWRPRNSPLDDRGRHIMSCSISALVRAPWVRSRWDQGGEGPSTSAGNTTLIVPRQHFLSKIPSTGTKSRAQKKYCVCYKQGMRRDVGYQCESCPDLPGLCGDPCFKIFYMSLT